MPDTTQKEFESQVYETFQKVVKDLDENSSDREMAGRVVDDLKLLAIEDPDEFIKSVFELSDDIDIEDLEQNDPGFNRKAAFLQSAADMFSLGTSRHVAAGVVGAFTDKTRKEVKKTIDTRARLLQKKFPVVSGAGTIAGFIKGPGGGIFVGGARLSGKALNGATKLMVKGLGGNKKFAGKMAEWAGQNFFSRTATEVAGGSGLYGLTKSGIDSAVKVAEGEITGVDAIKTAFSHAGTDAVRGTTFIAPYAAAGYLGAKTLQGLGNLVRKGSARYGKTVFGKDVQFQIDKTDLVNDVAIQTPDVVIAKAAPDIAKASRQLQDKIFTIQSEAKNQILGQIKTIKQQFTGELSQTAMQLNNAVSDLRQAGLGEIAYTAKKLYSRVGASYRGINRKYGKDLNTAIEGSQKFVEMTPVLDSVENALKQGRSIDKSGRLLQETAWAKNNPELFAQLSDMWERLGGQARTQGGKPRMNINIRDVMEFKKEIGTLSNFGTQATNFERVMRGIYNTIKIQSEKAVPELREINKVYAKNRSVIDNFRSILGKTENSIAVKLQRDIFNNKNILMREALEGFGAVDARTSLLVGQAKSANARLKMIGEFRTNPKGVFSQVRDAYLNGDEITLAALTRAGENFPELQPYLSAARQQAQGMLKMKALETEVTPAIQGNEVAVSNLKSSLPEVNQNIEKVRDAQAQVEQINQVVPSKVIALDRSLKQGGFGEGAIQREIVGDVAAQSPQAAQALERAEAARVVQRARTGEGIQPTRIEQIPIIGGTLLTLRKIATPIANSVLVSIGRAQPKLRKALVSDLFDRLGGREGFSKAALIELGKDAGPEAALVIYSSNGGDQDILQALESMGQELGGQ